jgi:hypothetical protein
VFFQDIVKLKTPTAQLGPGSDTAAGPPRLAVSALEAATMLGIGRSLLLQMDRTGELGPKFYHLGKRRVLAVDELRTWLMHGCPPRPQWTRIWAALVNDQTGGGA